MSSQRSVCAETFCPDRPFLDPADPEGGSVLAIDRFRTAFVLVRPYGPQTRDIRVAER